MGGQSTRKAQSAMEYLMTYGWAILIVAAALGSLFSLGVFNGTNFAVKVLPGACRVERLGTQIALTGECQGGLPQFVGSFAGTGTVAIDPTAMPNGTAPRTITAWIYPTGETGNRGILYYGGTNCQPAGAMFGIILDSGSLYFWGSCDDVNSGFSVPMDTWSFVAVNYTGSELGLFYDSQHTVRGSFSPDTCNGLACTHTGIGGTSGYWGRQFSGYIANIQVYNTSLSANVIGYIYGEGVGGAPTDLQHLVGWWPLNGDANDYGGGGLVGAASGITYVSDWPQTGSSG